MSVKGKSRHEWVAQTITNFADPKRREVLRNHFSLEAAYRAWHDILKIYGNYPQGARVWQETRSGEILNDTAYSSGIAG
jgi:hypothetical protein